MLRAHKTRIRNANPGSSIARALSQHDGATRWAYNTLLARLNDATQASPAGALWPSGDDLAKTLRCEKPEWWATVVPRQLYLPVGVNQFCRFTSLAWPRCWAALVR